MPSGSCRVLVGGQWKRKGRADVIAGGFDLGNTKPTRANSGLPSGWAPAQTITALTSITTAGATYTDVRFENYVEVRAADISFTRCQFVGPAAAATASAYIVRANYAGTLRARFAFCDIIPQTPTQYTHSIEGHDYTLSRCYIAGAVDGPNVYDTNAPGAATNAVIAGCCIEKPSYFSPCSYQSDNITHNDCIQHQGGAGTQIIGNTLAGFVDPAIGNANEAPVTDGGGAHLSGYKYARSPVPAGFWSNSAIQLNNNVGITTDLVIDRNWIDGGSASINVPSSTMTGLVITNNRFGQHARLGAGFNILAPNALAMTVTGNVDEASGAAANQRANGGS